MSKINDLIKELCPNGVKFYKLSTSWNSTFTPSLSKLILDIITVVSTVFTFYVVINKF